MAERPILFTGQMVRAILDGKKTETRRIVKPSNTESTFLNKSTDVDWGKGRAILSKNDAGVTEFGYLKFPFKHKDDFWEEDEDDRAIGRFFSRIQPGDLLWVKETWAKNPSCYDGDPEFVYKASFPTGSIDNTHDTLEPHGTWKPSIHMPRRASRINLWVMNVHAERLQDITDEGAIAEGMDPEGSRRQDRYTDGSYARSFTELSPRDLYRELWERINGEGSWALNPWVWVIKFEVEKP